METLKNPLLVSGSLAEQFEWVCDWLGRKRLTKTLDQLLEEGSDLLALIGDEKVTEPKHDDLEAQFRAKSGNEDYAKEEYKSFDSLHSANVLSIRFLDDSAPLMLSGGGDKVIKVTNYETGESIHSISDVFIGPVITMDTNPVTPNRVLMGAMDASHAIVDLDLSNSESISHKVVAKFKDHRKHVVRCRWSPNGKLFASASYDGDVHVYSTGDDNNSFTKIKDLPFKKAVEAVLFTADSQWLIVAAREDNYLHYFHVESWKEKLINMNASGDEHVSFTAMDINMSPDGKYLLTSTDKNRLIMFAVGTPVQARNFWGVENGQWATPRATFNASQSYVYTTSEDNSVYIFDISSEKKVHKLAGHKGVVRDIHRHAKKEIVATCSYDRSAKLWK